MRCEPLAAGRSSDCIQLDCFNNDYQFIVVRYQIHNIYEMALIAYSPVIMIDCQ
jgi:hypothetical protein